MLTNLLTIWSNPFDNAIEIAFSKFFDILPDFFKEFIIAFTNLGDKGIFFIVLGIFLLFMKKTRKLGFICLIGVILTLVINDLILKNIFDRARPFEDPNLVGSLVSITNNGGEVPGIKPDSNSFPSGHTFTSFTVIGGVSFMYIFNKEERKFYLPVMIFFIIFGILMAFSRVLVSHHYFTDVLAGAILGYGFGISSYYIVTYSPKLYYLVKEKYFSKNKEKESNDNN
ncbi:MAG: phosphatase PAP2 family protein [Firmicutes bacterium]|uniref:Phosphatase PAP2 family protein n=1 Tax=Candidatus Onthovivens merdipullorum TaxID=2840889 RepID=A0A9D9DIL4_9BACL|nr:phosphatase PAP2 family protein [Candidatus Onthovivens merdipullorum]